MKKHNKAVFLDRDGTILTERKYLSDPSRMKFYPNVFKSLAQLKKVGYKLIIVSNQSGLARGFFTHKTLEEIHRKFKSILSRNSASIHGIYFCPHLPTAGCACRKPKPAMIYKAARQFSIDLKKSFVVGDQVRDVELAHRVGARGVLVLTGSGRSSRKEALKFSSKITSNLRTASRWIIRQKEVGL